MSEKLNKIKRYSYILISVLCLVAICMIFAICVKPVKPSGLKNKIDAGFYGYEVVFGFRDGDLYGLKFSVLAFLTYLIAIGCIAISIFQFVRNIKNRKTIVALEYVLTAMLVGSVILFILQFCFLNYGDNLVGNLFDYVSYRPAVGSIISAVCSLCAVAVMIVFEVLQNKEHQKEEVMLIVQEKMQSQEKTTREAESAGKQKQKRTKAENAKAVKNKKEQAEKAEKAKPQTETKKELESKEKTEKTKAENK